MKTNTKKKSLAILSVALVAVIAVGVTLAFLSSMTEQKENVFTFAENIRAELDEPNWNPANGENLIPGVEMNKDPMVTNVSDNGVNEHVAIRLTFTDKDGDKLDADETLKLLGLIDIKWNTTDWKIIEGTNTSSAATPDMVYMYNSKLTPGAVTNPLFTSVTIKSDISNADYAWLAGIAMNHTADCYNYGTCDCTVTYKHHVNCAIYGQADAATVAKGGTAANAKKCDCTPAEVHESTCASLEGTLKTGSETCSHAAPTDTINGFQIVAKAAVVQADVAENDTDAKVEANLIQLFQNNQYTNP